MFKTGCCEHRRICTTPTANNISATTVTKITNSSFQTRNDHVDPFTPRMKAFTAKEPSPIDSASLN